MLTEHNKKTIKMGSYAPNVQLSLSTILGLPLQPRALDQD